MAPSDERLDRIVEALQQVNVNLEGLRVTFSSVVEAMGDHEQRLRAIEHWRNRLTPILAVVTFVLGAAIAAVFQRWI